ncbi:L-arabinose transport system permease protein AraQ [bacterium BMS3Abin02]|nr:L-arabinose transport system permease protein AraQ [bacterium BMS3Abin02]GBE22489.1 L-arabinose transport system permease protein AraQ [bacterium BMS3Bbin01]
MTATMARDKTTKASVKRFLGYAALVFFALVFILPFVLTIVTAFKTLPDIQQNPVQLWADPKYGWTLDGIRGLNTSNVRLPRWAFNSVVVTVSVVAGRLFFDSIAGFALAKMRFRGRQALFGFVIVVLAVPGVVLLIPKFLIMKELGILNTYAGLILPLMFDAFGVFLMKQFFEQLPNEMLEAAAIDGATTWQTFTKVALPLAAPALIALTILSTAGVWNDFMHPLIAVPGNPDLQTLPLGLANIRAAFGRAQPWNTILAGTILATIPIAIIFFIFQRYFVQGLAASGTKG